MKRTRSGTVTTIACGALLLAVPGFGAIGGTEQLDGLLTAQAAADKAAKASQDAVEKLDDATQDLVAKYRRVIENTKSITEYNEKLKKDVVKQREQLADIQDQLSTIESTSRDVFPLMQKMVDTLEQFVSLDVPFLKEERTKRVAGLKDMLDRVDVTVSEKFRRILEAYQIEMEYGRTLEAYDGTIGEGDAEKSVSFVRVGRVALIYQTPDGSETGYWDKNAKDWHVDNDYARDAKEGLRVAKKMGAPDLLWVPVPAPVEAQQ